MCSVWQRCISDKNLSTGLQFSQCRLWYEMVSQSVLLKLTRSEPDFLPPVELHIHGHGPLHLYMFRRRQTNPIALTLAEVCTVYIGSFVRMFISVHDNTNVWENALYMLLDRYYCMYYIMWSTDNCIGYLIPYFPLQ